MRLARPTWPRRGSRGATAATDRRRTPARRRLLLLLAGLVLLLGAVMAVLLYLTPVLAVQKVTVEGVSDPLATSVRDAAAIPLGTPLARVSESQVQDRVLADRRFASVEVQRHWPSEVTLAVTPREPALVVRAKDGTWFADPTGVVYEKVTPAKAPRKLPSVRVDAAAGSLTQAQVAGLVDLWRSRPDPAQLGGTLEVPQLRADGTVAFGIGQVRVEWGAPAETALKWKVVEQLLAQPSIDPQGAIPQTIDVSDPQRPVVDGIPPKPLG